MILAALLLAAAEPQTALEAEYAFAQDAKEIGQWTAFRKWAAHDAKVFDPWPVPLEEYLGEKADPEVAMDWWPVLSLQSCDGNEAFNMGHWRTNSGAVGYFVTHWTKTSEGWRYRLDGGAALPELPERVAPRTVTPDCSAPAMRMPPVSSTDTHPHSFVISDDFSIVYEYMLERASGGFYAKLRRWNGTYHEELWKERPPQ